jgi:hypothetical protein
MADENQSNFSLTPTGAHEYTTTSMSAPQLEGLTSRWLLKMLPWVQARGGIYRVNRVETNDYQQVEFVQSGTTYELSTNTLTALPILRGFYNREVLKQLAEIFTTPKNPPAPKPFDLQDKQYIVKSGQVTVKIEYKEENKKTEQYVYGAGYHFGGGYFQDPPLKPEWKSSLSLQSHHLLKSRNALR